jgi:hypothetical protein
MSWFVKYEMLEGARMKTLFSASALAAVASFVAAGVSFAGTTVPTNGAPAPLLGAGLPGLAVLAVAGAGYLTLRLRRRDRD